MMTMTEKKTTSTEKPEPFHVSIDVRSNLKDRVKIEESGAVVRGRRRFRNYGLAARGEIKSRSVTIWSDTYVMPEVSGMGGYMHALMKGSDWSPSNPVDFDGFVRAGIEGRKLLSLREKAELSNDLMALYFGLSTRSMQRRYECDLLSRDETEKALRLASIYERACAVFEDEDYAQEWLTTECEQLDDRVPVVLAGTQPGADLVLYQLMQIEYGLPA